MKQTIVLLIIMSFCTILTAQVLQIHGYIESTDGTPISNVKVILTDKGYSDLTNVDGRFVINGNFTKGEYKFTIRKENFETISAEKLYVDKNGLVGTIPMNTLRTHGFSFLVIEASNNNTPVEGAKIKFNGYDGYTTDNDGYCFIAVNDPNLLNNNTAIPYTVFKQGFGTQKGNLIYEEGKKNVDVILRKEQGVKIRVKDKDSGKLVRKAEVSIDGESIKTDKSGYVFFKNVQLGELSITVQKGTYKDVMQTFIFDGSSKVIQIEIEKNEDIKMILEKIRDAANKQTHDLIESNQGQ